MSFAVVGGALVVGAATVYSANQSRQDQTPWRTAGGQAVNALSNWYGLGGVAGTGAGTGSTTTGIGQPLRAGGGVGGLNGIYGPSATIPAPQGPSALTQEQTIRNTPGYQFNFNQGQQAVQRNLAAQGLLNSGAAGKALTQYGQGYADNYQQQYVSGLQSLAGLGQSSANSTGALGANAANQIGSNQIYAGNAGAYGQVAGANAILGGANSIAGLLGRYNSSSQSSYNVGGGGYNYGDGDPSIGGYINSSPW